MAVLEIKKYPSMVLKERAISVKRIDESHQKLIEDMIETMHAAPGIGLAAPQVGVSERIIVIDLREDGKPSPIALINPEIISHGEEFIEAEEGCLSLPGFIALIKRFESVVVKGLDREGKEQIISAGGLLSRALQHEIDHLDGTLILDRANFLKREFYKKKLKKEALRG